MNQRSRILAGLFGLAIAYAVIANVVYPRWIEPLVKIDERIAAREEELAKLQKLESQTEQAKREYISFMERAGSTDIAKVETAARERINRLINKYNLEHASVTPNRGTVDRKTGLTRMTLTISAEGTLKDATLFLKDLAEIPQLMEVTSATLYPVSEAGKGRDKGRTEERVAIRAPVELLVLPQDRILGKRIADADLNPPEQIVRHQDRDYTLIWDRTPFTEYIPLDPLVVNAGGAINVEVGQPAAIQATAQGGDGNYTFEWTPKEGLTDPGTARTNVDTSAIGNFLYTVAVIDGKENKASATVRVTVKEPPPPPTRVVETPTERPPPPPPVMKPVRMRSPNARDLQLAMILTRVEDDEQSGGVMVYDSRMRQTHYVAVGEPFEGGTLVYVHPRAALVEWRDEFFVYPVGGMLDQEISLDQTEDYPYLKRAVEFHREAKLAAAKEQAESPAAGENVLPADEETAAQGDSPAADGPPEQGAGSPPEEGAQPPDAAAGQPPSSEASPPVRRVAPRRKGLRPSPTPPSAHPRPGESTGDSEGSAAPGGQPAGASPKTVPVQKPAGAEGVEEGRNAAPRSGSSGAPAGGPTPGTQPTPVANQAAEGGPGATPEPTNNVMDAQSEERTDGTLPTPNLTSKEREERRKQIIERLKKEREERRKRRSTK
ncbi:MAG: hypothetical protein J5J06_09265 [Phycisphaerae bacterium]|nr:hypothetical protein [Phycisphaerae bacterium]